jgi:hypothetical protein
MALVHYATTSCLAEKTLQGLLSEFEHPWSLEQTNQTEWDLGESQQATTACAFTKTSHCSAAYGL